jgi:hypothetical protein
MCALTRHSVAQVKEGQRPAIPDSCIPSYKQLIERCWAQVPGTSMQGRPYIHLMCACGAGLMSE